MIDHLFILDADSRLNYNRKEIPIKSHQKILNVKIKADAVISSQRGVELGLLETQLPHDIDHIHQDTSKLARCLRSCLMHAVQQKPSAAKTIFSKVAFFGIQTNGTGFLYNTFIGYGITIYQLDHTFSNGCIFFQLYSKEISTNPATYLSELMDAAAALIVLKVFLPYSLILIQDMLHENEKMLRDEKNELSNQQMISDWVKNFQKIKPFTTPGRANASNSQLSTPSFGGTKKITMLHTDKLVVTFEYTLIPIGNANVDIRD